MSNYYTRTGDDGYTGLLGEGRVAKYHPRPDAVGTIDEATAALGVARAQCQSDYSSALILQIQRDLYNLMAEIAATPENAAQFRMISDSNIDWLEKKIDFMSSNTDVPDDFILPGDSPAGAAMALARTIVRRAERKVVALLHEKMIENIYILQYLNRLSSLCFIMELHENQIAGQDKPTLAKNSSP